MVKDTTPSGAELELQAAEAVRDLLSAVPAIHDLSIEPEPKAFDRGIDFVVRMKIGERPHTLLCEVKSTGQPRHARNAVHQLTYLTRSLPGSLVTPVFIAPYLSEEARAICREAGVGYVDLEGNSRLAFDNVFIHLQVESRPKSERRELRSLFKPKSAQVLRRLLRDPERVWKVVDLAEASGVSLGHASNVRQALMARDWAEASTGGLQLTAPEALLDHWRDGYEPPAGERLSAYTVLHGQDLLRAVGDAMSRPEVNLVWARFSAAQWLAPYGRVGKDYLYADRAGLSALREAAPLDEIGRGANLEIMVLADDGLFLDTIEPAPGVKTTSPVQTYLDLANAGERGEEAARHLRSAGLRWPR